MDSNIMEQEELWSTAFLLRETTNLQTIENETERKRAKDCNHSLLWTYVSFSDGKTVADNRQDQEKLGKSKVKWWKQRFGTVGICDQQTLYSLTILHLFANERYFIFERLLLQESLVKCCAYLDLKDEPFRKFACEMRAISNVGLVQTSRPCKW